MTDTKQNSKTINSNSSIPRSDAKKLQHPSSTNAAADHTAAPGKKTTGAAQRKKSDSRLANAAASLDEADGKLDWADMTAADEAHEAAAGPGDTRPPLTEAQLAKRARQKAKQKEKRAARKAGSAIDGKEQASQPPSEASHSAPQSAHPAKSHEIPEAQSPEKLVREKGAIDSPSLPPAAAASRGRGRGSSVYGRGFTSAAWSARGRGSFGKRGAYNGFPQGRAMEQRKAFAPQPPVEWPNGVTPPTMPRAQREELEKKRQAAEAAAATSVGSAAAADSTDVAAQVAAAAATTTAASIASESVRSPSGTATPATTAASSSPDTIPSSDPDSKDRAPDSTPTGPARHAAHPSAYSGGYYRGNPFRRGRGGFSSMRGRGGAVAAPGYSRSGGFPTDVSSSHHKAGSLQFGSVAAAPEHAASASGISPGDRRREAADLAAEAAAHETGPVVKLPGASRPASQVSTAAGAPAGPSALPAGFAVDGQTIVWDLRHGSPRQVGPWSLPEVQVLLQEAHAAQGPVKKESLPPHMRALFGQSAPSSAVVKASLPPSAARAAAFKPAGTSSPSSATFPPQAMTPAHHHESPYTFAPTPPPMDPAYDYPYYTEAGPAPPPQHPSFYQYYDMHDQHPHDLHYQQQQYQQYPANGQQGQHPYFPSHPYSHPGEFEYPSGSYDGMPPMEYYDPHTGAPLSEFDPSVGSDAFYTAPPPHVLSHHHAQSLGHYQHPHYAAEQFQAGQPSYGEQPPQGAVHEAAPASATAA